ncbi:hypothetical protein SKAU_G00090370 [Synaphobranchus kaupii]|uniref:Uncharacterized protein n=1 Tax=Synaphobranchus kaupii TaxID=118154 RepID=A0A9Q1FW90_SYNKA|nr:hypothetical protein SKAU_G00090370 [Synaphobranchus kaupii]
MSRDHCALARGKRGGRWVCDVPAQRGRSPSSPSIQSQRTGPGRHPVVAALINRGSAPLCSTCGAPEDPGPTDMTV